MNKIMHGAWCAIKWTVAGGAIVAALAYAGSSDYTDHVVTEMKNNGAYYHMEQEHPNGLRRRWSRPTSSTSAGAEADGVRLKEECGRGRKIDIKSLSI